MSWFEKLFIVAQKLQAGKFLLVTPRNPPPLDLHHVVERGGQKYPQNLTRTRSGHQSVKSVPWEGKKAFGSSDRQGVTINKVGRGYQNPFFLPRSWKSRFWGVIVGHRAQWYTSTFCTEHEAHAEAHNRKWKRQWWSWQPRKLCRGQLYPRLANAEVEEKWFTGKDNLPKHSKEKDKYNKGAH